MINTASSAAVRLSDAQIAAIKALATRDFDPAEKQTTMIGQLSGDETPIPFGYSATRNAAGSKIYELTARCDGVPEGGQESPLPILLDGDSKRQVGALRVQGDGVPVVSFSRSGEGSEARRRFEAGEAGLSIAYLKLRAGRRAAALSLRTVTSDGIRLEGNMSDTQTIAALGKQHNRSDLAVEAITAGKTLSEFRSELLEAVGNKPLDIIGAPAITGRAEGYSLAKAIRGQINGKLDGFEAETHQELSRSMPVAPRGVVVPSLLLQERAAMTTSTVANLVGSMPRGDLFVDRLQPASAVMAAGATMLAGLDKAITVPKETAELAAAFVAEGSAATETSLTIGSISLSPKRVSGTASFTLETLIQSNPSVDVLIRSSLTRQLAQALDQAALSGNGTAPNPRGIVNTSGVNTLTAAAGGAISHAEALTALAALEADNVPSAGAVFLMHPTDFAKIAAKEVATNTGIFVIDDGAILGRRVIQSTLATAGKVVVGDFQHVVIGLFGGTDLVVDNYTEARKAQVIITMHQMSDVAVRHAEAFCVVTLTP
jgi:HK97 family phage major capsid protein